MKNVSVFIFTVFIGLSLSRGEDMGDQSFWMSAAGGGTLPGALAIAGVTSTISFANRLVAPDNEDRWGTITDHVSGGATMDYFGNTFGTFNTASGGKQLYYQGFVVYGDDGAIPIEGGFEHFGHALFAQYLDNKAVINHEIRHAKQMEKRGNRIGYYRDNYGWFWGDGAENCGHMAVDTEYYDSNKYEIDAYYSSWLYEQGAVDIYGRKKKDGRLKDWKHSDDNVRLKFIEYYNTEIQKRTNNGLGERSPSDNPFQLPTDWQWRETYFTGPGF